MAPNYRCTCCGKKLNPRTMVSLDLDTRIGRYHDQVPEEHSQGGFDFGPSCAKKERLAAWEELSAIAKATAGAA